MKKLYVKVPAKIGERNGSRACWADFYDYPISFWTIENNDKEFIGVVEFSEENEDKIRSIVSRVYADEEEAKREAESLVK